MGNFFDVVDTKTGKIEDTTCSVVPEGFPIHAVNGHTGRTVARVVAYSLAKLVENADKTNDDPTVADKYATALKEVHGRGERYPDHRFYFIERVEKVEKWTESGYESDGEDMICVVEGRGTYGKPVQRRYVDATDANKETIEQIETAKREVETLQKKIETLTKRLLNPVAVRNEEACANDPEVKALLQKHAQLVGEYSYSRDGCIHQRVMPDNVQREYDDVVEKLQKCGAIYENATTSAVSCRKR
jgi:hypothetical protein